MKPETIFLFHASRSKNFYDTGKFSENAMRRVQKHKLFHGQEQEKNQRKTGAQENVQEMQKAYFAQGNEIANFVGISNF